jgi:hypothetical protein
VDLKRCVAGRQPSNTRKCSRCRDDTTNNSLTAFVKLVFHARSNLDPFTGAKSVSHHQIEHPRQGGNRIPFDKLGCAITLSVKRI